MIHNGGRFVDWDRARLTLVCDVKQVAACAELGRLVQSGITRPCQKVFNFLKEKNMEKKTMRTRHPSPR